MFYNAQHIKERQNRVKAALRKRGTSFAQIARELNVSAPAISLTCSGHRSERIEAAIASAIGTTPKDIWPDRYANEASVESIEP